MKKSKFISILSLMLVMIISLIVTACGELAIKEIQMDKNTFKGVYVVGEEIDYSQIQLTAVYEDGSTSTYKLTDKDVSYTPIDVSSVGTKEFKVTVKGYSVSLTVVVNPALVSIEIFNAKTNYALNEDVDYSAILLKAVYGDDSEEFIKLTNDGVTYNQIDTSTAGEKVFAVEYKGKTANLTIKVSEPTVQSIEIESGLKAEYKVGEEFNANEIKIKVVKDDADATVEYVYLNDSEVSYSLDLTSQGEKTLSITYGGVTIVKVVSVVAVLQRIEFESQEALVVDYKTPLDYANIFINAIYNDANVNETINLSNDKITILQDVDVNELGKQTLLVEYEGKQASIEVEVKKINAIQPLVFELPQSYIDFKNESAVKDEALITENEFAIKGKPYIVGSVNKFKFLPITSYLDLNAGIVEITNPDTSYSLQIKKDGEFVTVADDSLYISSVKDNMYDFTDEAVGNEFKLIVSLDSEMYDLFYFGNIAPSVSIEFKVEKAYNVYDVYGLSVMDNLNVNNWAQIKDRTLVYDDKKLSEYTDVTLVVLHNDVSIDADKLPNNYFWSEYMPGYSVALAKAQAADNATGSALGYASKLKGSLRDGIGDLNNYNHTTTEVDDVNDNIYDSDGDGVKENYCETTYNAVNMQKGIFNTNQCSISGNYMTITTKDSDTRILSSVISRDYKTNDSLKMSNPIAHWFMFKFFKTGTEELDITIENVFLQGNMPKVNQGGLPAGLMAINSLVDELTVDNVITSQFYTHILTDESDIANSALNLKNSRMIDAYSNMIYLWKSKVNVENSILKNAGGPLFIVVDGNRSVTDTTSPYPVLNVDEKSVLESYAAGTESWYTIFNATALFTKFKDMNNLFKNMTALYQAQGIPTQFACDKSFVHKVKEAEQINLIAVVIPNTDTILTARSNDDLISIKGQVRRGNEVFDIDDVPTNVVKSLGSVAFSSNGQYLFMPSSTTIAPVFALASQGLTNLATVPGDFNNSSNWLSVTMSAASLGVSNAPYFNVIIADFNRV